MDIKERYNRMDLATHVVFPDDKTIHVVDHIEVIEDFILIETDTGFFFNDMDVFTIHEMVDIEYKIKELLR